MTGGHEQVDGAADPRSGGGHEPGEAPRDVAGAEHDHAGGGRAAAQFHRRHGGLPAERPWKQDAASIANMIPRKGSPRL